MLCYGKTASNAVAAMSYLAQIYKEPVNHAGSQTIADARGLSKPLVAKLMTILATGGLVNGTPGPGGGYRLAKAPKKIRLIDIVSLFERADEDSKCPFGPNWCGKGAPCPLHEELLAMKSKSDAFLKNTTLDVFIPE